MPKQKKQTVPDNPNEQNQNGQPTRVPLLSNVHLDEDAGIGLAQGAAGKFSSTHQGTGNQALQNINFIVNNLYGEPNERGSIPDACAQEINFAYMLGHPNLLKPGEDSVQCQWRGALCAYILSPFLLFGAPPLAWNNGQNTTLSNPFRWEHVSMQDLGAEQSPLGDALLNTIGSSNLDTQREWRFLVMQQGAEQCPVLSYDGRRLTVPSASLADLTQLVQVFPWINQKSFFVDPLDMLDLETLRLIDHWISAQLTAVPSPLPGQTRGVLTTFQNGVRNRMNALNAAEPFSDVWEDVLKALLLRDLVDTGVTVFRLEDRLTENAFNEAMLQAPPDPVDTRTWQNITGTYPYGIHIGDQFAGFLDSEQAIWLPAPGYLRNTPAYQTMKSALAAAMQSPPFYAAYRHRLQIVLNVFVNIRQNLIAVLHRQPPAAADVTPVFSPERYITRQDDVALLPFPFDVMSRVCCCRTNSTAIFTPVVFLYKDIAGPLVQSPAYRVWHVVVSAAADDAASPGEEPAGEYKALLPLTACGAAIIRTCEALRYAPSVTIQRDALLQTITATLRIDLGYAIYEWTQSYTHQNILIADHEDLPAVGYWPDAASGAGEQPWRLYYTYVNFRESPTAKRYMAQVYDANGLCLTPPTAAPVTMDTSRMHYVWQTQASLRQPSFCLLLHNGQCIGCLLLEKPKPLTAITRSAVLAIDFGTTSTTGAVMMVPSNLQSIIEPVFEDSVLHWTMNENQGVPWSLEQFIAKRFNCLNDKGIAEPFFSTVARFTADAGADDQATGAWYGNELFTDGHIYYFGNSIHDDNLMGNPRYFSLKLQDISNPHSINGSNTSMFLRQVLETYLLFCRMQGASVSEIRFAFPLAFDPAKQKQFRHNIDELVSDMAPMAGMPVCKTFFTSESQAVCAYFCGQPGIQRGVAKQGIITLDIGGGTSDYSYCRINPGQTLCHCYSNYLAGHMLLGEYAYRCRQQKEHGFTGELNWYFDGCNDVCKNGDLNEEEKNNINALAASLDSKYARSRETFIFCIERFVSLYPDLYSKLLLTNAFNEQYSLLLFELTLLLWLGYLLGTQKWANTTRKSVCIHMGGNGAHLFHMLEPGDLDRIRLLIPPEGGVALTTDINRFRKREVAEGLLQTSVLLDPGLIATQVDCEQTAQQLWEAFAALCVRFLEAFPQRDGDAIHFLRSLNKENAERLKERFLHNVTSFTDLCRYLPDFCGMMITEIIVHE